MWVAYKLLKQLCMQEGMLSLMFSAPDNLYICKTQPDVHTQGQTGTSRNDNTEIKVEKHILHPDVETASTSPGCQLTTPPSSVLALKNNLCMMLMSQRVGQLITSKSKIPLWLSLCCNSLKNEYHKEDHHTQRHYTHFPPPLIEGCKQHRLKTIMRHTYFFNTAQKE